MCCNAGNSGAQLKTCSSDLARNCSRWSWIFDKNNDDDECFVGFVRTCSELFALCRVA